MQQRRDRLSNIEITFLISSAILGVTGLHLPRLASQIAPQNPMLATITTGILACVFLIVMVALGKRFPNDTIIEYGSKIAGNFLGRILGLVFIFYFLFTSGTILRSFASAVKGILLKDTPLEFIMITMLLTSMYLVLNGISSLAKVCESFSPLVVLVLSLVILLSIKNFAPERVHSIINNDIISIVQSIPHIAPAFLGYEIILFIYPFMFDQEKVLKYSLYGITIPIILFSALVIVSVGVFGIDSNALSMYPTLEMTKYIEFPGAFAERFDIFFMVFWIIGSFITLSCFYYMATLSITRWLGLINYKPFVIVLFPIIIFIGLLPQNAYQIGQFLKYVGFIGIAINITIVLLLLISILTHKKER